MKFCPYCGACLVGSAVYLCPGCGEALPEAEEMRCPKRKPDADQSDPVKEADPLQQFDAAHLSGYRKPGKLVSKPKRRYASKKRRRKSVLKPVDLPRKPLHDPSNAGYDGYYDDIMPIDDGHIPDRMDPELIKRIIYIGAGALAIIIISIILMYLL